MRPSYLANSIRQPAATARSAVYALGGGGARGIAHLGVLERLEALNWRPKRLVGVSIGAMVAAMVATRPLRSAVGDAKAYLEGERFGDRSRLLPASMFRGNPTDSGLLNPLVRIRRLINDGVRLSRLLRQPSILPGQMLADAIEALLPDIDISDTSVPLWVVAADLTNGTPIVLKQGPLRKAVQASASIPGIFPPVEFEGKLLCDVGGVVSIPTELSRESADESVVAVDVNLDHVSKDRYDRAVDVLMRMEEIGEYAHRQLAYAAADIVICPPVGDCAWHEFDRFDDLIQRGRAAVDAQLQAAG